MTNENTREWAQIGHEGNVGLFGSSASGTGNENADEIGGEKGRRTNGLRDWTGRC